MFEHFPSKFAMKIAYRCDLVVAPSLEEAKVIEKQMLRPDSGHTQEEIKDMYLQLNTIEEFQKLAVASGFEDSLIAYYDVGLTEKQRAALLLIHKMTPTYIVGHLTSNLLSKVQDSQSREMIELTSAIIAIIKDEEITQKDKANVKEQTRKFVVRAIKS